MKIRVVEERNPITLISNEVIKHIREATETQEFLWWIVNSVVLLRLRHKKFYGGL
jgi:hypothetical protein